MEPRSRPGEAADVDAEGAPVSGEVEPRPRPGEAADVDAEGEPVSGEVVPRSRPGEAADVDAEGEPVSGEVESRPRPGEVADVDAEGELVSGEVEPRSRPGEAADVDAELEPVSGEVEPRPRPGEAADVDAEGEPVSGEESEDELSVRVRRTHNTGRRVRDKKYFCVFCNLEVAQLPRHMYSCHSDELEVQELMAIRDPLLRKRKLSLLRHIGNHQHNLEALRQGTGNLNVVYRPSHRSRKDSSGYVPCQYCFGYYGRKQLWRHVHRCPLAPVSTADNGMKPARAGDQILTAGSADIVSSVIDNMRQGPVRLAIRNDTLVHELTRKLMCRVGNNQNHINYVRARLRKLGRLLLQVRSDNVTLQSATLSTLLAPEHFKAVVQAVKVISGYDDKLHMYESPSVGVHLGHDLRKCALTLKSQALQTNDLSTVWKAQSFVDLCTSEWNYEISGGARRNLQNRKFNCPKLLPLTSDVSKLTKHVKDVQATNLAVVKSDQTDESFGQAFKSLSDATLAQLILFNRRRQGEVSALTVECFTKHAGKVVHWDDIQDCLSPLEKQLCQFFTRVEIPGKRNNCVPLLLTDEQVEIVNYICSSDLRRRAGIDERNPFVFALTKGSVSHIRGHDVLRSFADSSGADKPAQLRSSSLRKHIATMSQLLNLKNNELDQLAQFMGHDVRVHRQFYRLPNDIVQTAQVVKVLMAMDSGTIAHFRGQSLEDIDVADHIGMTDGALNFFYVLIVYHNLVFICIIAGYT